MRIINIIADSGPGGAPTHVVGLLRGLEVAPANELHLIAPSGWIIDAAKNLAHCHILDMQMSRGIITQKLLFKTLTKLIKPNQPTIVHVHGVRAGLLMLFMLNRFGKINVPIIYTEHLYTRDYRLKNRFRQKLQLLLLKKWFAKIDCIIAVSYAVEQFLIKSRLTTQDKIAVIHNGVILPKVFAHPSSNQPIIGSAGSLLPVKRFDLLIQSVAKVKREVSDVKCEIIGTGQQLQRLNRLIKKLDLVDNINIIIGIDKIEFYLRSWRIFVSTSSSESFGLAIAEAMAHKLPVITFNVGGIPELVTKDAGVLVPNEDIDQMSRSIIDLLHSNKKVDIMGNNGYKIIADNFQLKYTIAKTINIYKKILIA